MFVRRVALGLFASTAALSASLAVTGEAKASTMLVTSTSVVYPDAPAVTASLHLTSPSKDYASVYISPQTLTGTLDGSAVSLFAYCVDILNYSGPGTFDVVSLFDYLGGDTTKYNQIASLIATAGGPANRYSDAAAQAAIWELMYENSSYNVGSGNFRLDNVNNDPTLVADANSLLVQAVGNAGQTGSGLQLFVAKNDDKQDMLFWKTAAVPEPATWAMMLLGFGGIGFQMRRRRPASPAYLPQIA
jgi:PEP-CTERM motif